MLAGTEVSLNGRLTPLVSVSPGRIDAQLPYGVTGPATLRVSTPNSSVETPVLLARAAPVILRSPDGLDRVPAIVSLSSGALITAASPARRGEMVAVFVTGLGAVDGEIEAGQSCPASPPISAREPVEVQIGDVLVKPDFAGLSPGFVGVYRVEVRIPYDLRAVWPDLKVVTGGISSDPVTLFLGRIAQNDK
jgi:uncharacterized protein (TIGR03437 family)